MTNFLQNKYFKIIYIYWLVYFFIKSELGIIIMLFHKKTHIDTYLYQSKNALYYINKVNHNFQHNKVMKK